MQPSKKTKLQFPGPFLFSSIKEIGVFLPLLLLALFSHFSPVIAHESKTYRELSDRGNQLFLDGDYPEAIKVFNQALDKASELQNPILTARIENNLGFLYYYTGQFEKAMRYYLRADSVFRLLPGPDHTALATLYSNIGALKIQTADFSVAVNYFEQAEALLMSTYGPDHSLLGSIYLNMGVIFHYAGEFEKSQEYYNRSLQIFRDSKSTHRLNISRVLHNMGMVSYSGSRYEEAIAYFYESLETHPGKSLAGRASAYNNLARALRHTGNYHESGEYFRKAIETTLATHGDSYPELGLHYLNYSMSLLDQGQERKAEKYLTLAGEVFSAGFHESHPIRARHFEALAQLSFARGQQNQALAFCRKAREMLNTHQPTPENKNQQIPVSTPIQTFLLDNLKLENTILNAKLEKTTGQPEQYILQEKIFLNYEHLLNIISGLRKDYSGEGSKLHLSDKEKETFVSAASSAFDLFEKTGNNEYLQKAFEISGLAKASVLIQSIRGLEGFQVANVPDSIREKEAGLRRELHALEGLINQEARKATPEKEKISYWQTKLFETNLRYQKLISLLEKTYPEYYRLKYEPGVTGISKIQATLSKEEVLIEYLLGKEELFIFAVSHDGFEVFRYETGDKFIFHLEEVLGSLNLEHAFMGGKKEYQQFTESAYFLYNKLIEPVLEAFSPNKLIIVPDEMLSLLPYEVLLSRQEPAYRMDYSGLPYLIRKVSISYSYSSALLFSSQELQHKKPAGTLLALAPDYPPETSPQNISSFSNLVSGREGLFPLPGARKEVEYIGNFFKGKVFVDEAATKEAFFKHAEKASILHLAMHALIDTLNPMHSRLVFNAADPDCPNSNLYAYEIYGLRIPAEMLVLSACNTGTGKQLSGEGVMSFTRSFLYSGVRNIVMTLWSVPDLASTQLIKSFYSGLNQQLPKDQALQQAKLNYLDKALPSKAHPFFWAGYVTIGDTSPLASGQTKISAVMAGLAILLIVLAALLATRIKTLGN